MLPGVSRRKALLAVTTFVFVVAGCTSNPVYEPSTPPDEPSAAPLWYADVAQGVDAARKSLRVDPGSLDEDSLRCDATGEVPAPATVECTYSTDNHVRAYHFSLIFGRHGEYIQDSTFTSTIVSVNVDVILEEARANWTSHGFRSVSVGCDRQGAVAPPTSLSCTYRDVSGPGTFSITIDKLGGWWYSGVTRNGGDLSLCGHEYLQFDPGALPAQVSVDNIAVGTWSGTAWSGPGTKIGASYRLYYGAGTFNVKIVTLTGRLLESASIGVPACGWSGVLAWGS